MLKSTALKIVQSFSKKEISEFEDFLNSPFHNKKSGPVKLFREIKKSSPDYSSENLDKEKLWTKIFPGKKYHYGIMKNLIQDFTKLAEQFISQLEFRSKELTELETLYKALEERNLWAVMNKKESILTKKFNEEHLKDLSLFPEEFYYLYSNIFQSKLACREINYPGSMMADEIGQYLDEALTAIILRMIQTHNFAYSFLSVNPRDTLTTHPMNLLLKSIPDEMFERIIENLRTRSEIKYLYLMIFYLMYKAYTNLNDSSHYFRFKDFFYENYREMPRGLIKYIDDNILVVISLITDESFNTEPQFHEAYKFKHTNNLLIEKSGVMNSGMFFWWTRNIFNGKDLTALEEFVKTYKKFLIDDDKDDYIMLSQSLVYYLKSDFKKAIDLLMKVNFRFVGLRFNVKKYMFMLYYEVNDYESFVYGMDSYKHFLDYNCQQNKIPERHVQAAKIFCKNIDRLFKIRESGALRELELFEKEVSAYALNFRSWFIWKVEELKQNSAKSIAL